MSATPSTRTVTRERGSLGLLVAGLAFLLVVGARVSLPRLTLGRRRRRLPSDEARPQRKECEMAVSKGGLWQAFKNIFTFGKAAKK